MIILGNFDLLFFVFLVYVHSGICCSKRLAFFFGMGALCFRFNASKMLDLIRGKRLVFVGDSINRNQWESMLCMLMGAIRDPKKVYETHGRRITKEKGNYSFKFVVIN